MRRARDIWVGIIGQYERSGLTQEAFAEERGIPVGTLRSWIYRLRREAEESPAWLPVRVVASTAPAARQGQQEASRSIEVVVEGAVVRLPPDTTMAAVAELLSRLRGAC